MYKNKTFLAIIAARGGSKRLPKKNILNLAGKPLISWTIEAGIGSKYIDEVMVTTDSKEIYHISKEYGANVPFLRPKELATDLASRQNVIKHTLNFYKKTLKKHYDYIIYLQPTSPLRMSKDIDDAIEYMFNKNADAIVSVCELEYPYSWSGGLPKSKNMSSFLANASIHSRSQDLAIGYRLNGAIYICDTNLFLKEGCLFLKKNIFAFEMKKNISVDIDIESDFLYAEFLMERRYSF